MPDFITVSIDVTKVDKGRLIPSKREGSTAKYLSLTLIPNKEGPDKYDNEWFITQSLTKEEKERGIKAPIIGNAKRPFNIGGSNSQQQNGPKSGSQRVGGTSLKHTAPAEKPGVDDDDSLPF